LEEADEEQEMFFLVLKVIRQLLRFFPNGELDENNNNEKKTSLLEKFIFFPGIVDFVLDGPQISLDNYISPGVLSVII
jgi:hypothetical protein